MNERFWHLKNCALFEQLKPEEIARLEQRCRARRFAKRSPVYLPSDKSEAVLLLARGRVKLASYTAEGKQAILTFIEPGEMFGELAVLGDSPREEYAEAVEPSLVILVPREEIQRLMAEHPELAMGVTRLIGLRRRRIERRLRYLLFRSSRERLLHLLVELLDDYGQPSSSGMLLNVKLAHQDLANIIGTTRETVTILLGELQTQGLLKLGRRRLWVVEPDRLRELAIASTRREPIEPGQRHSPVAAESS